MTRARFTAAVCLVSFALPLVASALTTSEITARIDALLAQVAQLQAQLSTVSIATSTASTNISVSCPHLTRSLIRGASGADVRELQQFLFGRGLLASDSQTGFFGANTEAAVQQLQIQFGVVASGTPATTGYGAVGSRTARAIIDHCTDVSADSTPIVPPQSQNACPVALHPDISCSGVWQSIAGSDGCTSAWQCVIPIAQLASSTISATSSATHACAVVPHPATTCSGYWQSSIDAYGCVATWQCIAN